MNQEKEELVSLNSELTEFSLQELEQRLETDPLAVGGLLNIASSNEVSSSTIQLMGCEQCNGLIVIRN